MYLWLNMKYDIMWISYLFLLTSKTFRPVTVPGFLFCHEPEVNILVQLFMPVSKLYAAPPLIRS